jgi:dihydroorotate dehydrogenase
MRGRDDRVVLTARFILRYYSPGTVLFGYPVSEGFVEKVLPWPFSSRPYTAPLFVENGFFSERPRRGKLYKLLRPLLFLLPAEVGHRFAFALLRLLSLLPGARWLVHRLYARRTPRLPVTVMGLDFPNPVGLAAGLDKNAEAPDMLAAFGFGFLELGTVTPRPQPGNPLPRLFRLGGARALINRMGFNNVGVAQFLNNLYRGERTCPVGVNIGKNRDTPNERAGEDYVTALRAVYPHADYIAVNVSSPNTPGLRELQGEESLEGLLRALKTEQDALSREHARYVPIALKIAPDLTDDQIAAIARLAAAHRVDAVIATNTTVARPGCEGDPLEQQEGGLSGAPLKALSTQVIRKLHGHLQGRIPIIGVGGIETADDAWEMLVAGASLVQLYTVLIYDGPGVVRDIVRGLLNKVRACGCSDLGEAVARAGKSRS